MPSSISSNFYYILFWLQLVCGCSSIKSKGCIGNAKKERFVIFVFLTTLIFQERTKYIQIWFLNWPWKSIFKSSDKQKLSLWELFCNTNSKNQLLFHETVVCFVVSVEKLYILFMDFVLKNGPSIFVCMYVHIYW